MKKPEDYLELFTFNPNTITEEALSMIKQVQIDAIKETCEVCANGLRQTASQWNSDYYNEKNKIMLVAAKLIKELEDGNKD